LQRKRKDAIDVNSVLLAWKFLETNENTAYGSQLMAPQLRQMNDIKGVSNLKRNKKAVSNLKRNKKEKRVKERIMISFENNNNNGPNSTTVVLEWFF
jgi:hypothetical protein